MTPLTPSSFTASLCQATVFTAELPGTMGGLVRTAMPRWLARFDGEPAFSADETGDLRVSLRSASGAARADVTATRTDLFQVLVPGAVPDPAAFFPAAAAWLLETAATMRVTRLAAVLAQLAPHDAPGAFLSRRFCQPRWTMDAPQRFELAWHARAPLGDDLRTTNAWIRIRTAPGADPSIMKVVHVEQDLNTLVEDAAAARFTAAEVTRWFAQVAATFAATLDRYFGAP